MPKALTVKAIENAKTKADRMEIPDGGLSGLYLIVQPSGAKSWAVRYRYGGKPRKCTLGPWPALGLSEARKRGGEALAAVSEGRDPGREKAVQRATTAAAIRDRRDAFETVAMEFINRYSRPNTRESSWRETARLLGLKPDPADEKKLVATGAGLLARWRALRVQEITRRDVIEALDEIADRGAPILANRTLAALRRMMNWACERDIIAASPCAGVKAPAAERSRDRVLSDDELRAVWDAASDEGWPFGHIVKLLILTGQRRDEVGEMRWSEINLDAKLWTIPRERSKNDQLHEVSLSGPAVAVLTRMAKIKNRRGLVFTTNGETPFASYSKAKDRLDKAMLAKLNERAGKGSKIKSVERWTLHDLRRTAASGMARLGVNLPVIEKVLNHSSGTFRGVVGVYQRHSFADEKRTALEAWGRFVTSLAEDRPAENVISMSARA
jgi:integrase